MKKALWIAIGAAAAMIAVFYLIVLITGWI